MTCIMCLELRYTNGGGGLVEQELEYEGSPEEIAEQCDRDNNELLRYMMDRDDTGPAAFCFQGFMFTKQGLLTARLYEPSF